MKLKIIVALLLLSTANILAQGVVKGKVMDETGLPIPNAVVRIKEGTKGAKSDANGEYKFSLNPGTFAVSASCINYEAKTEVITVSNLETAAKYPLNGSRTCCQGRIEFGFRITVLLLL